MFNFRIINLSDGNQVIDPSLKTPYDSLTPLQMLEYLEVDDRLAQMEHIKRIEKRKAERQRKRARNPFYRLASMCGLI